MREPITALKVIIRAREADAQYQKLMAEAKERMNRALIQPLIDRIYTRYWDSLIEAEMHDFMA